MVKSLSESNLSLTIGLIIISSVVAVVYLPMLGYLPLYMEEPRRALVAAQMLATGDYFTPVHAGQIYLGKPPLFNWLICVVSLPFGAVTTWSARLPSVLALWFLTLFLVASSWQRLGAITALFWGCAVLLSPEILIKGQMAEIDVVFTCLVTAALWSWWLLNESGQRRFGLWILPLFIMALAYLTKREPAIVFFYFTVGTYLLLQGRGKELLEPAHLVAMLLATIPIIIWIWGMAVKVGWEALWQNLLHEVIARGEGKGTGRYVAHILTYPAQIIGAS